MSFRLIRPDHVVLAATMISVSVIMDKHVSFESFGIGLFMPIGPCESSRAGDRDGGDRKITLNMSPCVF